MKTLSQRIFEDITPLKNKLLDLINNGDLDEEDIIKMINVGKYSDRVLGYKSYDKDHTEEVDKKGIGQYKDNIVYRYIFINNKTGRLSAPFETASPDPIKTAKLSANVWSIASKEPVKNTISSPLFHQNPLKDRLNNMDINDMIQKNIINTLRNGNMIDRYLKYIENPKLTVNDIINNTNIFKICEKQTGFNKKNLINLAMIEAKDSMGTSLGHFEILLKMMLADYQNTTRLNGKGGDVIAGGLAFEIKGKGGRLCGQECGDIKGMNKVFKKSLAKAISAVEANDKKEVKTIDNPFINPTALNKIISEAIKIYDQKTITKAVADAMRAYYQNNDNSFEKFLNNHWKDISKDPGFIYRAIGCLQIIEYQKIENWDYMIIFDEQMSPVNGNYKLISRDDMNLETLFNIDGIFFEKGMHSNSSRDKALGIIYKS